MTSGEKQKDSAGDWVSVRDGYAKLADLFPSRQALQYHLTRRDINGLTAVDAVRPSPLGKLLIRPSVIRAWVLAEPRKDAA